MKTESDDLVEGQAADAGTHPVIFFDGVCGLCDASVQFILKRDRRRRQFRFSPLQSDYAASALKRHGIDAPKLHSIVLLDAGRAWQESSALLRIARRLGFPWSLFAAFYLLPRPLRDGAYRLVARNRYRLAKRKEACRLPTREERAQFIM